MFSERLFEITAGTAVVVLASIWLLEKRRGLKGLRPLLGAWWVAWAAAAGFSYFALVKAEAALTSIPAEDRLEVFSTWLDRASVSRLLSTAVLVLGLIGVFLAWARGERGRP